MNDIFFLILVSVIILSITTLLISNSSQTVLIFLGILYLCSFLMLLQVWPLGLAFVQLLAGLLTVIVINSFCSQFTWQIKTPRIAMDILMVIFVSVITFAFAPQLSIYLTESSQFLIIGFFMFVIGLLQAGTSQNTFQIFISLFIFTLGFLILYAPLEGSALVTALISVIQVALAFVGSRMVAKNKEEIQ